MGDTLSFGKYIRQLRIAQRKGLREAAKAIGITAGHLSKVETGAADPPKGEVIQSIARYYQVPVQELMKRAEDRAMDAATADQDLSGVLVTFYRLALGRPRDQQIEMLLAALDKLDLAPDERNWWEERLRELAGSEGGGELLRLNRGHNDLFDLAAPPRRLSAARIEQLAVSSLSRFFGGDLSRYRPPTPIEPIIEAERGIEIDLFGDEIAPPLSDGSPPVLGLSRWTLAGRRQVCLHERLLDSTDPVASRRANFTLGHEFFHAIEHLPRMQKQARAFALQRLSGIATVSLRSGSRAGPRVLQTAEDWREWQANKFSAAILMPAFAVRHAFIRAFGAEAIEVPETVLEEACFMFAREQCTIQKGQTLSLSELFEVNPRAMAIRLKTLRLVKANSSSSGGCE